MFRNGGLAKMGGGGGRWGVGVLTPPRTMAEKIFKLTSQLIPSFTSSSAPSIAFCTPKECATIVTSVPRKDTQNDAVRNTELVLQTKFQKH